MNGVRIPIEGVKTKSHGKPVGAFNTRAKKAAHGDGEDAKVIERSTLPQSELNSTQRFGRRKI